MITKEDIEQLKPFQARAIIESLRKGLVPTEYVAFFTVGRQNWLKFIEEDLEGFIAEGGGKVRFINGDYGDGKTHFMSVIRQLSLQKQFASSFIVLTRDIPIHKFELVYQEIVFQLRGRFTGIGLRSLVQQWIEKQKMIDVDRETLFRSLRQVPKLDINFVNALMGLLRDPNENELSEVIASSQELLYQWLEGKKIPKKDLAKFHIFEILNKSTAKTFLQSLISFLKLTGHKGLILLLDELETVLAQGASIRSAAYENIRLLMDSTEHSEYLQLFFSLIPDVLLSEKGFKSYDALWSRVRSVGDSEALNYRGTIIDLHKTPLKRQELIDLGICLRKIHEISYRWKAQDAVSENLIADMCKKQEEMGILSEVRLFIKQMIRFLDMAEQGHVTQDFNVIENLLASHKEMELEKIQKLEPAWDV
ncbi:MAG: DUF2791 family P-loop domain-containing protein [Chlamydiia bacterium]|nr:DUF2791 family P-loop domain-containing protein [Chlamydiia bacterium]